MVHLVGGAFIGILLAWLMELWVNRHFQELKLQNPEEFPEKYFQQPEDRFIKYGVYLILAFGVAFLNEKNPWHLELISDSILFFALLGTAWVDWKTLLIEVKLVALAMLLRLVWLFWFAPSELQNALAGWLIGAGLLYLIGFLYETIRHRQGLGDGDAAVLALIGLWVGWQGLGPVLLIAALSGIIISSVLFFLLPKQDRDLPKLMQTQIPFAPFLCIGGLVVHFLQKTGFTFLM